MPDQVKGYQIPDGRFFETFEEADYEEMKSLVYIEATKSINIPENYSSEVILFVEAHAQLIAKFALAAYQWKNYTEESSTADELSTLEKEIKIKDG